MKKTSFILAIAFVAINIVNTSCRRERPVQPPTPINNNRAPVAKAGNDQAITLPVNSVNLDGSGSSDAENNIVSYQWVKISGPSLFTINNINIAQAQVSNLAKGIYEFELKVTDAGGLFAKDTVMVNVNASIENSAVDVFVAGWEGGDVTLWKNGVAQNLTDNLNASDYGVYYLGVGVYVSEGVVYVAGGDGNGAKLWKNGVAQSLSDGGWANSVYVSETDVYVAGYEKSSTTGNDVAKLWKNGVAQNLSNGSNNAYARSVFVSGADVYVAGWEGRKVTLWKNGVAQSLTVTLFDADIETYLLGVGVYVSGGDVYVAGGDGNGAKLWKNGVAQNLSNGSWANSVYVSGGDVYVAGQGLNASSELWKNGVAQTLTNGSNNNIWIANSVYVSGTDVFVAGGIFGSAPRLWDNGVAQDLSNEGWANSVFVIRK